MNQILSAVRSSFRARTVAASLLLATALPLAAIAAPEGELRIAVGADATTFHPHVNSLPVGNTVDGLVFQQLFRIDADNKVVPALATDYGWSEDGLTFTVSFETGHSFTNGHVVRVAQEAGASMIMDSDAHAPGDLLTREFAMKVALGAGLDEDEAYALLDKSPLDFLNRLGVEHPA